jgi:hypothetical protein
MRSLCLLATVAVLAVILPDLASAQGCSGGVAFSAPPTVGTGCNGGSAFGLGHRHSGIFVRIEENRRHIPAHLAGAFVGHVRAAADHAQAIHQARIAARSTGCGGSQATFGVASSTGCGGGVATFSTVTYVPVKVAVKAIPVPVATSGKMTAEQKLAFARGQWLQLIRKYGFEVVQLLPEIIPAVTTHGWQVIMNPAFDAWVIASLKALNSVPPQPIPPMPPL